MSCKTKPRKGGRIHRKLPEIPKPQHRTPGRESKGLFRFVDGDGWYRPVVNLSKAVQMLANLPSMPRRRLSLIEQKTTYSDDYDDLSQMVGPMTDDAIRKVLQNRFTTGNYYTNVGPIVVSVNPQAPFTTNVSLEKCPPCHPYLQNIVQRALDQLHEAGYSQAIVMSGESGSGKTTNARILLRQVFEMAGGGLATDTFKHVSASMTVLRSLSHAAVNGNVESSRMGSYIEVYLSGGVIHRAKTQYYFIDQNRVIRPQCIGSNFQIFYEMLAGLTTEEKVKFHLQPYSPESLIYLNRNQVKRNVDQDAERFQSWKTALTTLGIPFSDVLRVLAAVLLLGNIQFSESDVGDIEVIGNTEIKSVAALLGVSGVSLYRGLTCRTQQLKSQTVRNHGDALWASKSRDALVRALYCRTVNAITKRANNLKKVPSHFKHGSNDSEDTYFSRDYLASRKDSSCLPILKEGLIGIVDMFGFENCKVNRLEQVCTNLCAETMQHFYNAHVFKSIMESYQEDDVQCDTDVEYTDNSAIIELISAQYTGILSLLESESQQLGSSSELYLERVCTQHADNPSFLLSSGADAASFTIKHHGTSVEYNTTDFIETNKDEIGDDVINIFSKKTCNFGFVSHLFSSELKSMNDGGVSPQGIHYRMFPATGHVNSGSKDGRSTFCQDFHSRLDVLLKTLVQSKPHFVRCIRPNTGGQSVVFDRDTVLRQVRSLQLSNTVQLMAGGFPHRMRYKTFNNRYNFLSIGLLRPGDRAQEECMTILEQFLRLMDENSLPYSSATWALGRKYIFLSENARQQFEHLRGEWRFMAATRIQTCWRRFVAVCQWPTLKSQMKAKQVRRLENARKPRQSVTELITPKHVYPKPAVGIEKFMHRNSRSNSPAQLTSSPSPLRRSAEKSITSDQTSSVLSPKTSQLSSPLVGQQTTVIPEPVKSNSKPGSDSHPEVARSETLYNSLKTRPPPPPVPQKPANMPPKKPAMEVKPMSHTDYLPAQPLHVKSEHKVPPYVYEKQTTPTAGLSSHDIHVGSGSVRDNSDSRNVIHSYNNNNEKDRSHPLSKMPTNRAENRTQNQNHMMPYQSQMNSKVSEIDHHDRLSHDLSPPHSKYTLDGPRAVSKMTVPHGQNHTVPYQSQTTTKAASALGHDQLAREKPSLHSKHKSHPKYSPPANRHSHQPVRNNGSPGQQTSPVQTVLPPSDVPPPIPGRRPYTVKGNYKVGYPQTRVMKENFSDERGQILMKGEEVQVTGVSPRRGYLVVERNRLSIYVPYHIMELKTRPNSGI